MAEGMYGIRVLIEGVAPILFNRITSGERAVLEGEKAGGGKVSKAARQAEALERVYREDGRGLVVPQWNVKRCIVDGANRAGLKDGRASLSTFLMSELFVRETPAFGVEREDFVHEALGRKPARTGAAAIIRRPALAVGWRLPFELDIWEPRRSPDAIRIAIETAGSKVGLGSWRPEFGRFIVREFEVET